MTTETLNQPPATAHAPQRRQGWSAGRITGAVSGTVIAIVGVLLILGGAAIVAAHAFSRDDDGYYSSGTERLETDGYAISTENINLGTPADKAPGEFLGTVRVRGESAASEPLFVGIGPRGRVESYLSGTDHSVLTDIDDPEYRRVDGARLDGPPEAQDFWAAQTSGRGEQTMEWEVEGGDWSVVFMNADGSRPVALDAGVAIDVGWLIWVGLGMLVAGVAITIGGIAMVVMMRREANRLATPGA